MKQYFITLLRRAEHFTKTDNIYLVKNGIFLAFTHSIGVLSGFSLYLLIAHFLPKEVYGQYKYFLSLFGLFGLTCLTGMESSLTRSVAQGYEGSLWTAFKRKLQGGAVGSLIAGFMGIYYLLQHRPDFGRALFILAIFGPWIYAGNLYTSFLSGKKNFKRYTHLNIITTLLAWVGMASAFLFLRNPLLLFFIFLLTSLTNLIALYFIRGLQANTKEDPQLTSYALHLSFLDVFGVVANNIDSILIFHFLGAPALAVYSLAIIPVEQMKGLLKSVQSIAIPKFATNSLEAIKRTMQRKLVLFSLCVTMFSALYIVLAPLFYRIFFPAYQDSVPYSQWYSLSLIVAMPASLLVTLFQSKAMRQENTWFMILNYSIQITLLVLGSWWYGVWGAIAARMLARLVMFIISYTLFIYAREEGVPTMPFSTPVP